MKAVGGVEGLMMRVEPADGAGRVARLYRALVGYESCRRTSPEVQGNRRSGICGVPAVERGERVRVTRPPGRGAERRDLPAAIRAVDALEQALRRRRPLRRVLGRLLLVHALGAQSVSDGPVPFVVAYS